MYAGFGDNDSDGEQHDLRLSGRTERALQRLMASEPPKFDTGMSWNQLGLSVTNCPGLRELIAPAEGPDPRESRSPLPAETRPLSRQHEPFLHEGLDAFLKEKVDSFEAYKSDPIPGRPDQRYPTLTRTDSVSRAIPGRLSADWCGRGQVAAAGSSCGGAWL
jgi:hypothetical protein